MADTKTKIGDTRQPRRSCRQRPACPATSVRYRDSGILKTDIASAAFAP